MTAHLLTINFQKINANLLDKCLICSLYNQNLNIDQNSFNTSYFNQN